MHFSKRIFDLITLGQLLLRLSPPGNERLARSDVFEKTSAGRNSMLPSAERCSACTPASFPVCLPMTSGSICVRPSVPTVSRMTILFTTGIRTHGSGSIFMNTAPIPANRR